jgi:serine phosphatase RsbU (regulator of sigma subunit)
VGGDWYDVFVLPSGELWAVVGDVAGHSLHAAVVMGRIKSALRSFTLLGLPPHEVLRLVDRKIDVFEIDTTVTMVCASMSPPYDRMQVAVAGHPLPVIAEPDREAVFADLNVGPLLGLGQDVVRCSTEVALAPGATVVFYTDGLVERRHQSIDAGLERLRTVVDAAPSRSVTHRVMRELIGNAPPEDDVALLVLHLSEADTVP